MTPEIDLNSLILRTNKSEARISMKPSAEAVNIQTKGRKKYRFARPDGGILNTQDIAALLTALVKNQKLEPDSTPATMTEIKEEVN